MVAKDRSAIGGLTRRGALALGATSLLPEVARAQGGGAVLIMNSGAASLSVIDMATRRETRRIPVLREPHHWALTPDHKELLIGDSSGNELQVLDPKTFAVLRRMPISNPYHLQFSWNGKFLVIAGLARNQIDIYEAGTYRLLKRFPIRSMPSHMDFLPDDSLVFVTLQGPGRVVAIDLRRLEIVWNAARRRRACW
jgi:YVTN family beta-propeller protein